jgi:hypothetical protein
MDGAKEREAATPGAEPVPAGPLVVALDLRAAPLDGVTAAMRLGDELARELPGHPIELGVVTWQGTAPRLLTAAEADPSALGAGPPVSLARGGVAGAESALRPLLELAGARRAAAVALVAGDPRTHPDGWIKDLLSPVVEGGYDLACPSYARHPLDGALNTGVVYPLTRALYGQRLRQPLGGEVALGPEMARRLAGDADWTRDRAAAGSDAWLVAKALARGARVCQAWLGPFPRPQLGDEEASQALARVLGAVFREMERHADRWQRVVGSKPVPSVGTAREPPGEGPHPRPEPLLAAFQLGFRELPELWSLVLPPATLVALKRAGAAAPEAFAIDDRLWARVVYDFAVGHFAKVMEPRHLLAAMTPLYLGWVASFANATRELDAAGAEARVEQLCAAFEIEKRYLVSRWRWPDAFTF